MLRRIPLLAALAGVAAAFAAAAALAAPSNNGLPYITGNHSIGSLLTANTGTWAGNGGNLSYTFQWLRCAAGGVDCAAIAGATDQTYTITSGDQGSSFRVTVTANDGSEPSSATSAATAWVTNGVQIFGAEFGQQGTVMAKYLTLPNRLFIDNLRLTPGSFSTRSPLVARIHVTDLSGANVGGALVRVTALPSTWATTRIEAVSAATGWAWLRIFPTKTMPLTAGHQLALVIRARVPGSSGLAATSVRRVFQVPVH